MTENTVQKLLQTAIQYHASDLYLGSGAKPTMRVNGKLVSVNEHPELTNEMVETYLHQILPESMSVRMAQETDLDGAVALEGDGRFRVNVFRQRKGLSAVFRVIPEVPMTLNDLHLPETLRDLTKLHQGLVLITGPTGSGKTTTLYAILKRLNKPGVKIITLEDPVEYKLKGINQSQIDHSKEYTFAKGLRSILRQDPDIVLVGEIRDLETAETAIQASLTGHLLLSTIHTNDAAGAIPRFTAMGVKPFLLAPSLNAIMGQRLVRRVCESCKQEDTIEPDVLAKVKELLDAIPENSGEPKPKTEAMKFFKGAGCEVCNKTGYKGRVGIYEVLVKDQNVEKFILEGDVSEYKMREVATAQGMISMAQDGLLKAMEGQTSIEEIARVTGF